MASGRKPHFNTYWHSAFEIPQLREFLKLVNKVYRRDDLTPEEVEAVNNLKACVIEVERNPVLSDEQKADEKLQLSRAVSCSVNDPLWRECLEIVIAQSSKPDTVKA